MPHRRGYDLDYDRLFELAVETGPLVEIDGAPSHLDLDGALARRAVAAGATVAVDSDCHRAEMLDRQMQLGVITARRGWVEPRHVLNTRPLDDVRAFIAAQARRALIAVRRGAPPTDLAGRRCVVALAAFALYRATLLPGVDFGDTGIVPDDGRLADHHAARRLPAVLRDRRRCSCWLTGAEPAHALNLASARRGGARVRPARARRRRAVGLDGRGGRRRRCSSPRRTRSGARRSSPRSTRCTSLLVALTLLLLLRWAEQPTTRRLALFFAVYALGFGNHLSMILLAPAYTLFLLARRARRMAIAADAARRRAGGRVRRRRRAAVLLEPARALAAAAIRRAASLEALQHVLVRRHEGRLARHDGAERAARRCCATMRRCTGSICGSSSASSGRCSRVAGLVAAGAYATGVARC